MTKGGVRDLCRAISVLCARWGGPLGLRWQASRDTALLSHHFQ